MAKQTLEALLAWAEEKWLWIEINGGGWTSVIHAGLRSGEDKRRKILCEGRTLREALVKAQRKLGK